MNPAEIIAATVIAIEEGRIRDVLVPSDAEPNQKCEGIKRKTPGGHSRHAVADAAADPYRGYKPGEKTTKAHCQLVLEILHEAAPRPISQSFITDEFARRRDRPRSIMVSPVSASLLWLRATGVVVPGRKAGRLQYWILQSTIDSIVKKVA